VGEEALSPQGWRYKAEGDTRPISDSDERDSDERDSDERDGSEVYTSDEKKGQERVHGGVLDWHVV
jgi:hypothetical protein